MEKNNGIAAEVRASLLQLGDPLAQIARGTDSPEKFDVLGEDFGQSLVEVHSSNVPRSITVCVTFSIHSAGKPVHSLMEALRYKFDEKYWGAYDLSYSVEPDRSRTAVRLCLGALMIGQTITPDLLGPMMGNLMEEMDSVREFFTVQ